MSPSHLAKASNADGGEVYSTEETRIGTWIDGKPLYRKVYQVTTPSNNGYVTVATLPSDTFASNVVRLEGVSYPVTGSTPICGPANVYNPSDERTLYVQGENIMMHVVGSANIGVPTIAIVEYTKTTD